MLKSRLFRWSLHILPSKCLLSMRENASVHLSCFPRLPAMPLAVSSTVGLSAWLITNNTRPSLQFLKLVYIKYGSVSHIF